MIRELHFFNYDLTKKVKDTSTAPAGWYTVTYQRDISQDNPDGIQRLYYKGVGGTDFMRTSDTIWKDEFSIEFTSVISEDGMYIIISEETPPNTIIEEQGDFEVFEY